MEKISLWNMPPKWQIIAGFSTHGQGSWLYECLLPSSLSAWVHAKSLHLCLSLCNPMDCSLPGSSVHGILQARVLECCHALLQGIFLTQGSNPHLLHLLLAMQSSIPGLGRSPGEGNGNPLQYSCLGNSTDRGAWLAIVHGVTKSQTWQQLTLVTC